MGWWLGGGQLGLEGGGGWVGSWGGGGGGGGGGKAAWGSAEELCI